MGQAIKRQSEYRLDKDRLPQCKHCHKAVENIVVSPHPEDAGKVIIEYSCHGETAGQEISASVLEGAEGLARYKVFGSLTSGLMPRNGSGSAEGDKQN